MARRDGPGSSMRNKDPSRPVVAQMGVALSELANEVAIARREIALLKRENAALRSELHDRRPRPTPRSRWAS